MRQGEDRFSQERRQGEDSPLLIFDLSKIDAALQRFDLMLEGLPARLLYSVKALPLLAILDYLAPRLGGFSLSSAFEARLAGEVLSKTPEKKSVLHLTSPGLRPRDCFAPSPLTHVSFNSLGQMARLSPLLPGTCSIGLRINPGFSMIEDPRFDPCRSRSKLGVPLDEMERVLRGDASEWGKIRGLHFHAHFKARSEVSLRKILIAIEGRFGDRLSALDWINLGGGYAPSTPAEILAFRELIEALGTRFGGEIFMEPGHALMGDAGTLQATVIDRFQREGTEVAVLDTGVHHLPEVFEYQRAPVVEEADASGDFECLLVGESCLAGDLFGNYRFASKLEVGDAITFCGVGAYSLVKASRFNGHDFPKIALKDLDGRLKIIKHQGYEAYRNFWA